MPGDSIELNFLALGDSYTIGTGVEESERWPVQLVREINAKGDILSPPTILAKNGWTTGDLLGAIQREPLKPTYDLVSLLIGVNNQYDGLSIEEYTTELDRLLEFSVGIAGNDPTRVVVVSIPDWGVTPFAKDRDRKAIGREIEFFNERKKQRVDRIGCRFVDITQQSKIAAEDPTWLAPDGLHPAARMYAAWCALIRPVVVQALKLADQ